MRVVAEWGCMGVGADICMGVGADICVMVALMYLCMFVLITAGGVRLWQREQSQQTRLTHVTYIHHQSLHGLGLFLQGTSVCLSVEAVWELGLFGCPSVFKVHPSVSQLV